jgi:acyl-coenzyme A synthetase/AMP-(fatty) acid ligase
MPKQIVFRDSLPKTERGKMDRKALAAEWEVDGSNRG